MPVKTCAGRRPGRRRPSSVGAEVEHVPGQVEVVRGAVAEAPVAEASPRTSTARRRPPRRRGTSRFAWRQRVGRPADGQASASTRRRRSRSSLSPPAAGRRRTASSRCPTGRGSCWARRLGRLGAGAGRSARRCRARRRAGSAATSTSWISMGIGRPPFSCVEPGAGRRGRCRAAAAAGCRCRWRRPRPSSDARCRRGRRWTARCRRTGSGSAAWCRPSAPAEMPPTRGARPDADAEPADAPNEAPAPKDAPTHRRRRRPTDARPRSRRRPPPRRRPGRCPDSAGRPRLRRQVHRGAQRHAGVGEEVDGLGQRVTRCRRRGRCPS